MNFTRPNSNEDDKPEDWLASALFFTSALGSLLKEDEGVAVNPMGDLKNLVDDPYSTYIVYKRNEMIAIEKADDWMEDGQLVWIDN